MCVSSRAVAAPPWLPHRPAPLPIRFAGNAFRSRPGFERTVVQEHLRRVVPPVVVRNPVSTPLAALELPLAAQRVFGQRRNCCPHRRETGLVGGPSNDIVIFGEW